MKMEFAAEHFFAARAILGEGPLWDSRRQSCWWIDIERKELHCLQLDLQAHRFWQLESTPGGVVIRRSGGLILSLQSGFAGFSPETGEVEPLGLPELDKPANRLNDSKCDPSGRLWAGTMRAKDFMEVFAGSLYSMETDLQIRKHWGGEIGVSNGLAWSGDATKMYFVDSARREIYQFDFDLADGTLNNPRCIYRVPENLGYPDGMTIDNEGKLWVALWGGWCVARICPDQGTMIGKISLPVSAPSSCAFIGPKLNQLLITTAADGLNDAERTEQPLAGDLFLCTLRWHGWPEAEFGG